MNRGDATWQDADSPEAKDIAMVSHAMRALAGMFGDAGTSYLVSAFADVIGTASAGISDADFERDLAGIIKGMREVRAYVQSLRAVKS